MHGRPPARASGLTAGQESAKELSETNHTPPDNNLEIGRKFRTPGFRRMRTDWNSEDASILQKARDVANQRLNYEFADAIGLLNRLWDIVREPKVDSHGDPLTDHNGFVIWATDEYGRYIEDWGKLTFDQKEYFLFTITTNLFEWEQRAADIWQESMLAQAQWEERYSISYDEPRNKTMGEREAIGKMAAIDERYWAIVVTSYSRKAEALVRSIDRLAQRIEHRMR